ncbi:MAG: class II aldolase/adducin family protein [Alphaproteobacteria bacterium]|nr:class II aldolase/adducin family protein [Alphaproteobacteria bacterium]
MPAGVALDVYTRARRNDVSAGEWKARVDLAACYQLFDRKGWTDGINTHLSVRSPDNPNHFFLKPDHLLFHQVTASSMIKIDLDGNLVDPDSGKVNPAGAIIHSAVLAARSDSNCVLHHHTDAGIAVSSQEDGLLPMSQHALQFYNRVSFHEYEGIALDPSERASLQSDLGPTNNVMLLRNHGILVVGSSVGMAFSICDQFETACRSQIMAQQSGARLHFPTPAVCEHTAQQFERGSQQRRADSTEWKAMLGWLDELGAPYAQ